MQDKEPNVAAAALLDGALVLAEDGSWEKIAVGRAWYLGGDKAKASQIFESVTSNKKVEGSDWFRLGRVYSEAGEWDKARDAFDRALALDPGDDSGMIEYGALANIHKDRVRAEMLIAKAMERTRASFGTGSALVAPTSGCGPSDRRYFHVTSIAKKCANTSRFGVFFGFVCGLRI